MQTQGQIAPVKTRVGLVGAMKRPHTEKTTMDNLTPSEKKLFTLFKKGKEVTIDKIIKAIDAPSRQAATVRIKYFAAKVAPHGWIVDRTSKIGRGQVGKFQMEKKF